MKKHIIMFSIFVLLMIIFSFTDLEIAKRIYNESSLFGKIYEVIGEIPVYFGIVLFGLTFFNLAKKEASKILAVIISFIGTLLFIIMPARYLPFFNGITVVILSILSISLTILCLFLSRKLSKDFYYRLAPVACIYFIVCCCAPLITFTLKTIVGRVRFVDLKNDFSDFSNWYVINGLTKNYSFPSGHTTSAGTILALNNLDIFFSLTKKQKATLYGVTSFHIIATALSRMILGMHYATDVLFAFMICYVVKELSTSMFIKHRQELKTSL